MGLDEILATQSYLCLHIYLNGLPSVDRGRLPSGASVATAVDEQTRRRRPSLVDGHKMTCPRCREQQDILAFVPMQQISEFASETNAIYKCPSCRWIFSPIDDIDEDLGKVVSDDLDSLEGFRE